MGEDILELMRRRVESTRQSLCETVNDLALVTVIIPVRQEARFIARSLGAMLSPDYPVERLESWWPTACRP